LRTPFDLPPSGVIYLDSVVLIYAVEQYRKYSGITRPVWEAAKARVVDIVSSELALLETMAAPLKNSNKALQTAYEKALLHTALRLLLITQLVLREPARLRSAISGLRTPDALHAATAVTARCALFLTNDVGFRRIRELLVTIIDEVLDQT